MLFDPPPETRFDLRFSLAGIPIRVHPLFWIVAVLFGLSGGGLLYLLIWVAVIFISIVVHEMGHALMMRAYGQSPRIVLHGAGGVATSEPVLWGNRWAGVSLQPRQQLLVSLAGPGAGFVLAALVLVLVVVAGGTVTLTPLLGILPWPSAALPYGGLVNAIVSSFLWVNLFWGLVNLMPVFPLDGGQVSRTLFTQFDPADGPRKSLWVSIIAGAVVAVAGLIFLQSTYLALLFGYLAFQSYQSLRGRAGFGF